MTKRKVCIVGYSPKSRDDAPYDDDSFEFWGLNNLYEVVPDKKWHRWYDMHPENLIHANNVNLEQDHVEWLKQEHDFPVYMLREYGQYPASKEYPLAEIQKRMVTDWGFEPGEENMFHSGVAYPFAHALLEGVDEIHIYGVDMTIDEEYEFQRPNMTLWVGIGRNQPALNGGKVRVVVGKNCALLKGPPGLYGYDSQAFELPMRLERYFFDELAHWEHEVERTTAEINELSRQMTEKRKEVNTFDGCRQYAVRMREKMRRLRRGEAI